MGPTMAIIVPLLFWGAAIFTAHKIGESKRRTGWLWGFLLGWIGVIILACLGPATNSGHKSFRLSSGATSPIGPHSAQPPTIPPPHLPAAGWYADPTTAGRVRYWDGTAWTTYSAAPEASDPAAPPLPA